MLLNKQMIKERTATKPNQKLSETKKIGKDNTVFSCNKVNNPWNETMKEKYNVDISNIIALTGT